MLTAEPVNPTWREAANQTMTLTERILNHLRVTGAGNAYEAARRSGAREAQTFLQGLAYGLSQGHEAPLSASIEAWKALEQR